MPRTRRDTPIFSTQSLALILAACGGGGGGTSSNARIQSGPVSREGRVVDGDIVGAMVYVDTNENGEVDDTDVPLGRTNNEGLYSGQVAAEHADKPLLADLDGAYDTDNPGTELSGAWRAPPASKIISPFTERMVRNDITSKALAREVGLPDIIDFTIFDPLSETLETQLLAEQVLATGHFLANHIDAARLPDTVELRVELHENHPRNKPVFYGDGNLNLTNGYKDNHLFEIRDGRVWFKSSPDFETPASTENNNTYLIEFTQIFEGETKTIRMELEINDIDLERTTTDSSSGVGFHAHAPNSYQEDDLPHLTVQRLLLGTCWDSPSDGPLVLTWSIDSKDPEASEKAKFNQFMTSETKSVIEN